MNTATCAHPAPKLPATGGGLGIGFTCPSWPPGIHANGIVTYTGQIATALGRAGCMVAVFAGHVDPGSDVRAIDVSERQTRKGLLRRVKRGLRWRFARDTAFAKETAERLMTHLERARREDGLQLLEMEESFGTPYYVARGTDLPVVVRLHGPWVTVGPAIGVPQDREWHARVRMEGMAIQSAAAVTSPSQDALDRVRRHYGIELPDARVIPNPVTAYPLEDRWRQEEPDPDSVLFVGRFDRCKGADTLISAFAQVGAIRRNARLLFVGPDTGLLGTDGSSQTIEQYIRAQVDDADVRGRIRVLGFQSPQEIARLRRRAAVTVVCSRYENFPMTGLEAMSMGCPLVATAVGGLKEMVRDGENGLLCKAEDAGDLAEKVLRLLNDPALATRLGRQAAADCEAKYHPDVLARESLRFYADVIERHRDQHHRSPARGRG